jgi:hypothetical protein
LPEGTAKLYVYYQAKGRKEQVYRGIKPDFPTPIVISGQKPGVEVTWHVEAVDKWLRKIGYSNEVETVTKQ